MHHDDETSALGTISRSHALIGRASLLELLGIDRFRNLRQNAIRILRHDEFLLGKWRDAARSSTASIDIPDPVETCQLTLALDLSARSGRLSRCDQQAANQS